MKKKIFKYYFFLILTVLIVTIIFTSQIAQKYYKDEVENKLKSIGFSIEYYLLKSENKTDFDLDLFAKDYASSHNLNNSSEGQLRITFIDFSGNVLGDSEANYREMENHLLRDEIQEALKGRIGKSIRLSQTVNSDLLYIAMPLKQSDHIVRVSVPLIHLNNIERMIWFYSILTILVGLIVMMLVSLKITTFISRPLKDMIIASQEIANGNYSKRIQLNSTDELGQLAKNFNEMAFTLDKTIFDLNYKKIEVESIVDSITNGIVAVDNDNKIILINSAACNVFNIVYGSVMAGDDMVEHIRNNQLTLLLKETVSQNRSLECEVIVNGKILWTNTCPIKPINSSCDNSGGIIFIQDRTNVRKLEQLRTDFVSNVTHELKTPITSIRGFIETLKNGAISNPKVANKFLDIIDIEAERLHVLIKDILQLSEIETKLIDIEIETFKLKFVIDDVFEVLQNVANSKNIYLKNNVNEKVLVKANRNRIKQLILNLVDNGIKYNSQGGSVVINAYKDEDTSKIIISVQDEGIGIPSEHIERIFERFYTVDRGRSKNMGGHGLGLSIVKHIVNLYNGDIKVNSDLGKGTEFIVKIPFLTEWE